MGKKAGFATGSSTNAPHCGAQVGVGGGGTRSGQGAHLDLSCDDGKQVRREVVLDRVVRAGGRRCLEKDEVLCTARWREAERGRQSAGAFVFLCDP